MKLVLTLFLVFLGGCVSSQPQRDSKSTSSENEKRDFIDLEQLVAAGKFEMALSSAQEFRSRHPKSNLIEVSRIYEAQCLENLGRPQESLLVYRDVVLKTEKYRPEIAATALYRMASTYEALGDDMKMVAALFDAKARAKYLSAELIEAQIPAKLASAYSRQGQHKESLKYLTAAEEGLNKLLAAKGRNVDRAWLAQIYFEMGSVSSNQLGMANFEDFVEAQKIVQVYLLKALKLNEKTWSDRSQSHLQKIYRDLFTQIESVRGDVTLQGRLVGVFNDLIEKAELYRPLADEMSNQYEQMFYDYLDVVRKKTDEVIFSNSSVIPLTEESKKLNSIKRAGRIKPDAFLPEELNSIIPDPPKIVPTVDPNL